MAKKKKKRLKKSVKVGCSLILLLLTLGIITTLHFCSVGKPHTTEELKPSKSIAISPKKEKVKPNPEIRERLLKLIDTPQRLDTNLIAFSIYDITAQTPVVRWHDRKLMPPASCLKLLTSIAALRRLGMDHQYCESVAISGDVSGGTLYGDVLFTLDDDPLCESLTPLVDALSQKGIHRIEGHVVLDMLRNDTLRAHTTAASWDIPYHKVPLLLKGRPRVERDLTYAMRSRGITIVKPNRLAAPSDFDMIDRVQEPMKWRMAVNKLAKHSKVLYSQSTKMTDVITPMMIHSSNIKADALFYHMNHVFDRFCGNRGGDKFMVQNFIEENLKYPEEKRQGFVINDGSGLSPENRVTADFLLSLVLYAWNHEDIRNYFIDEALATPGHPERHGSLLGRMSAAMYRNKVFCKTGTVTSIGASSLCGFAEGQDGHWYAFAIVNEDSPVAESRIYQDKVCKELVR